MKKIQKFLTLGAIGFASQSHAAITFSTTNADINGAGTGFTSGTAFTTFDITAVGHQQGLNYDPGSRGLTGTVTSSVAGQWRASAGTTGFQAFDFQPTGGFQPGVPVTVTVDLNRLLSNGEGTAGNAPLAATVRTFDFTSPPSFIVATITTSGGSADLANAALINEQTGADSSAFTTNSATWTADENVNNGFIGAFRNAPTDASVGDVDLMVFSLEVPAGGTAYNSFFRFTVDGTIDPVPEPSTAILGALSLLGMLGFRRRQ